VKAVVFAGGVGGAKLVDGLAKILSPDELSAIVNTGDDFEYLSLQISPDLDTVCYTMAGLANPETGWGQRDESWVTFETASNLGKPDWFQLGDKDLATHLVRTLKLSEGQPLSEITHEFCTAWSVRHRVFPMSDEPVRTIVHTKDGRSLGFQEYFVHQNYQPVVASFEFIGAVEARPAPGALEAVEAADVVILAPSNPWVSIDPILAVPGYREVLARKTVVAVSPLIAGRALKGPAAKIYRELSIDPSAASVANHYREFLTGFVFDTVDRDGLEKIEQWRIIPLITDIIMKDEQDRVRLAQEVLSFCESIFNRSQ